MTAHEKEIFEAKIQVIGELMGQADDDTALDIGRYAVELGYFWRCSKCGDFFAIDEKSCGCGQKRPQRLHK